MNNVLDDGQRRLLDSTVQKARVIAEDGAEAALKALAVDEASAPQWLTDDSNQLRLGLRGKARQLGDDTRRDGADLTNLIREVAYEQWHRLLFAKFLEANGLLRHPEHRSISLTLADCAELAPEMGEPDGWTVAAKFAAEILPGVFRLDDPAVKVQLPAEYRQKLEKLIAELPNSIFKTEDALGWVYQFWQTAEKTRVNSSGEKIGGSDISPVTQLFTENYMVRFLLENSLGAWWAARHPDSPLIKDWEYLRWLDDDEEPSVEEPHSGVSKPRVPAAGTFPDWPATAAAISTIDPCCGSGHFIVSMFGMLWRMRAEEEGLSAAAAQDAVLRDNLFGLELDPRCTQIATFNVALEAWKQGGFRDLPNPQIACSGIPVRQSLSDWLEGIPGHLVTAMTQLHDLFRNAETLGSLINPRTIETPDGGQLLTREGTVGVPWAHLENYAAERFSAENEAAPTLFGRSSATPEENAVIANAAKDVLNAADLLYRNYNLVATNPPFLMRTAMDSTLQQYLDDYHPAGKMDLATAFIERSLQLVGTNGAIALVSPQNWLFLGQYTSLRDELLRYSTFDIVARLGPGAFREISGEVVKAALTILEGAVPKPDHTITGISVDSVKGVDAKAAALQSATEVSVTQTSQSSNPDHRITFTKLDKYNLLGAKANAYQGIATGDYPRFGRFFWELPLPNPSWEFQQSTVIDTQEYGGREHIVHWENGVGVISVSPQARVQGLAALNKKGVAISQMGNLRATLFDGQLFDNNTSALIPTNEKDLPAIWAYLSSDEYNEEVRNIDAKLSVTNATLVKVPFDKERWQKVANEKYPNGLPEPYSDDPTQWLFKGEIVTSTNPLQVAVASLLGYRWPDQPNHDALDKHVDADGIVALVPLPGEAEAATRLRALLADAYGDKWSAAKEKELIADTGGKADRLEGWLRDEFFAQHVKLFGNRPFIWQIWDGQTGGFSALVNYHKLDRATLEKLTFTTLGRWIDRQTAATAANEAGADVKLRKALELQEKLKLILAGAPPYDVYVRWQPLAEQPIGWNPDLDDGVRLNIRPFVTANILRSKAPVKWDKDRGKNPDGSDRINDLHPTLAERQAARDAAGRP